MNLHIEYSLPQEGAILHLGSTQNRIIASSQNGGTSVISHTGDSDAQRYMQESTLELGKLWAIACLDDHLAAANRDGIVRLWSLETKENIREFHGHEGAARAVHFLDDRTLVSADNTGVLPIWDLASGECRHVLRGHEGDVTALTSHDELLVSGGLDKCLRIWNTATGQCIHALEGHDTGIGILEWNADYTLIVTGASGGAVKIWRVSDGMCVADCVGHTKIPTRIVDWKERLVTASADGMVREWDWQTGREMKSMRVHDGINPAVRAMEFLGDSDQMVTAGMDGKVKLWDYKSERCTEELLADQRVVWIGRKIGEDWFAITGRVVEDVQYLKIFKIGS